MAIEGRLQLIPEVVVSPVTEFVNVQAVILGIQNRRLRDDLLDVLKSFYPDVIDLEVGDAEDE